MVATLKVDTLTDSTGAYSVNVTSLKQSYANMYYSVNNAAGSLTISDSSTYGVTMAFNKLNVQKNITVNVANNTWTHAYTGIYQISCSYRQDTGGDLWTVLAVTKGGTSNAVGVSARTGSANSSNVWTYFITYSVDSTTATYQLQHWSATASKTVSSSFTGGPPGWTNYSTLVGGTTGDNGRMVDYTIMRLGDL